MTTINSHAGSISHYYQNLFQPTNDDVIKLSILSQKYVHIWLIFEHYRKCTNRINSSGENELSCTRLRIFIFICVIIKKNYYEIFNEGNLNNKYFGVKAISGEDKP